MCVSSCGATCWTGCLPAAQSIPKQHLFPLCPSLIRFTVCSSCSFSTLSLRCSRITRCVQIVEQFSAFCCVLVHIHNVNWLYQCDAVVYQWFSSNIFYSIFILQRLRGQSVLDLLLSALSSNPGGETGFDRLATGFHSAVPALTQALTDELHVLSRLAEPHTILGFLNTAYLSTITYELASQMERECETALRDNTTLSSKIKKYSARSLATVGKCLF